MTVNSLPDALDRAAERKPRREAVSCQSKALTYAELQRQADALACLLIEDGVARGHRVGLYISKSIESAVALYGIMKAGAAYVPLDPFAPAARLRQIMSDCGIRRVVTKEDTKRALAATGESKPNVQVTPEDTAYILYTSGSTGTPKGIVHTHASALCFAEWAAEEYGLTSTDRVSNHAPLHFDLSTFDFFATALACATTVIVPEFLTKFPAGMSRLIAAERMSVWYSVPLALIQMLERGNLGAHDLSALRWVLFAGEPFPTKHLRRLMAALPEARFSNLYGPTETNVCTFYHVRELLEGDDPIPIGVPCPGTEMRVVDEEDGEVAPGAIGELLIRGGTVMRGYWGGAAMEASEFYRTGDLVALGSDGNLKYIGRKDRQIKTRGYRVELDEIEAALLWHEDVQEAAVYAVGGADGTTVIKAAVIARGAAVLTQPALLKHLAARLPSYALPVEIVVAEDFPRTSTGKVNRLALAAAG